jgi:hypothetical protein
MDLPQAMYLGKPPISKFMVYCHFEEGLALCATQHIYVFFHNKDEVLIQFGASVRAIAFRDLLIHYHKFQGSFNEKFVDGSLVGGDLVW